MAKTKKGQEPAQDLLNQLIAFYNARHYVQVEISAGALVEQYPDSGAVWKILGVTLLTQGKESLFALRKAAKLLPEDAASHFNLGNALKALGQLEEAMASYRRALNIKSDYAEAYCNMGAALRDLTRFEDAVAIYRRALAIKPDYPRVLSNLGLALNDLEQFEEAAASSRRAIEIKPDYAEAHNNLGLALKGLGKLAEAEASFKTALAFKPDFAEAHNNLGIILGEFGKYEEAAQSFRRTLEIRPDHIGAHSNLGAAMQSLGHFDSAVEWALKALEINPDFVEAYCNLGNAQLELGRLEDAVTSLNRALEIKPDYAEAHNNKGLALKGLGKMADAEVSFKRAGELKTNFSEAHNNLGIVQCIIGQYEEAQKSYQRALESKAEFAEVYNNLGNLHRELGQLDDAAKSFRQALQINPDYLDAFSNLLFILNYTGTGESTGNVELARQYGRLATGKVSAGYTAWQCTATPDRLRVGVVSGDLREHVVGHFLEGLLPHIDPNRIELFAYPTLYKEDELTARIRPCFKAWKPLTGITDETAARLIHDDGVHILLDLSGHTAHNRLPVFSWKPAPVQASWLGYFATTGVAEMDYVLVDEVGVPEAQQVQFTETVWYLPDTRLCFTAPKDELSVSPLLSRSNAAITFGCFQDLPKVGEEVLAAWGEIFAALPKARLRMQCKQFGDSAQVEQMLARLQRYGIHSDRVELKSGTTRPVYLAAHAEVDMILDTFPYPGGTTTCEALWMGVPTLTLAGDRILSRQGASLLTAAGLPDWVVESRSEYINKAITMAGDLQKLSTLRASLRQQVLASPLFDGKRFAQNLGQALWRMWGKYRDQQEIRDNTCNATV